MKNVKKENIGSKSEVQKEDLDANIDGQKRAWSTAEKAQYEVFRNGSLPRETIEQWLRSDLKSIMSLVDSMLKDQDVFKALADSMFIKYQQLHAKEEAEKNG